MKIMIKDLITKLMILCIKFYKAAISPYLRNNCRYTPTCSEYAMQAIETYGPLKGTIKAISRISRCHPWGGFGYDPLD